VGGVNVNGAIANGRGCVESGVGVNGSETWRWRSGDVGSHC
jgi:hypothetical protein